MNSKKSGLGSREIDTSLTVVLSNYNHAAFLPHALEGLLRQTRPADQLIFIDDASTDNSVDVFQSFVHCFPNVFFCRNDTNCGVIWNLNQGLLGATGSMIYFAAADDVTYPDLFSKGIGLLLEHQSAAIFSARSDIIDANGRNLGIFPTPVPFSRPGFLCPDTAGRQLMQHDSWLMGNTAIYRKAALLKAGGFPDELGSFTDGYVGRLLALTYGACFTPDILASWRRLPGGYAWGQTTDRIQTQRTIQAVKKRMLDSDVFPNGYFERWRRRHLFAAERFSLVKRREAARQRGPIVYLTAFSVEILMSVFLMIKLRPYDILEVAARRIRSKLTKHD